MVELDMLCLTQPNREIALPIGVGLTTPEDVFKQCIENDRVAMDDLKLIERGGRDGNGQRAERPDLGVPDHSVYISKATFQRATLATADGRDDRLEAAFSTGTRLDQETKSSLEKKPGLFQYLLTGLGVGAIALLIAEAAIFLTTRPGPVESASAGEPIALVCQESEPTAVLVDRPDYQYQGGSRFYGRLVNGKPADGRGTMLYASGNRYDGEYREGQRNGCGTFTFKNGRRYVGEFKDDVFSGRGVWTFENGDRYVGDFKYSKCHGKGKFIFADGTSQSGTWRRGNLIGGDLSCDRGSVDLPDS